MIKKYNIFENYLKSDAKGYKIGKYVYHITPERYLNSILKYGFKLHTGGTTNLENIYEPRLYFTTSLIAAYDLAVNFSSFREEQHIIFKVKSNCIKDYEEDELFPHGIYVEYPVNKDCIIEYYNQDDFFDKFDEDDIENLY